MTVPLAIRKSKDGATFDVRVQPGAKKSRVVGVHGDALKVAVAAPPVDGKANEALCEFLARALGLRRAGVEVIRGHTSRQKTVMVHDATVEQIQALLADL